jgi:hypothetical protein
MDFSIPPPAPGFRCTPILSTILLLLFANTADAYRLLAASATDEYRDEGSSSEQDCQRHTYARIFPDDFDEFYAAVK